MCFEPDSEPPNPRTSGAAVSHDGGVTWTNQQAIQVDLDGDPTQPFNDKESVTADPIDARVAYVVWDRLALRSCGPAGAARRLGSWSGSLAPRSLIGYERAAPGSS